MLLLVVDGLLDARPEVWLGEKGGCKGGDGVWPGFQYGAGKDVEHGLEFGVFPQIPFVVYSQHNQLFVQLCLLLPTQQPPLSSLVSRPWRRPIRHRRRSRHAHPTHDVCGRKRAKTGGLTKRADGRNDETDENARQLYSLRLSPSVDRHLRRLRASSEPQALGN